MQMMPWFALVGHSREWAESGCGGRWMIASESQLVAERGGLDAVEPKSRHTVEPSPQSRRAQREARRALREQWACAKCRAKCRTKCRAKRPSQCGVQEAECSAERSRMQSEYRASHKHTSHSVTLHIRALPLTLWASQASPGFCLVCLLLCQAALSARPLSGRLNHARHDHRRHRRHRGRRWSGE